MNRIGTSLFLSFPLSVVTLAIVVQGNARPAPIRQSTPSQADREAWQDFCELDSPAMSSSVVAKWEQWADTGIVYGNPNVKPKWPTNAEAAKIPFRTNVKSIRAVVNPSSNVNGTFSQADLLRRKPIGTPIEAHGAGSPQEVFEVRMNRSSFDYIVGNNLWNLNGQVAMASTTAALSFPTQAREIKAVWKPIALKQASRFHTRVRNGVIYGLTALHITTNDPADGNWFWATFEQIDNPRFGKVLKPIDAFGYPNGKMSPALAAMFKRYGLGPEFAFYRLGRSQTTQDSRDHLTPIPTLNGNSEIEGNANPKKDFMATSSCMTCHYRSTINTEGKSLSHQIVLPNGQYMGFVGPLQPAWLKGYMQRDFVWSLIEAKWQTPKGGPSKRAISRARR